MRLALTQPDETVEQLATRVYSLDKPSATQLKSATTALTEANPFLRKPEDVPPGTVLAVPEQEGLEGGSAPAPIVAGLAADQLRGAIVLLNSHLTDALDAETSDAKATAKLARSSEVKAVVSDDSQMKEAMPTLNQAVDARVEDAKTLRTYQKDVFARIATDLEGLVEGLGSS